MSTRTRLESLVEDIEVQFAMLQGKIKEARELAEKLLREKESQLPTLFDLPWRRPTPEDRETFAGAEDPWFIAETENGVAVVTLSVTGQIFRLEWYLNNTEGAVLVLTEI